MYWGFAARQYCWGASRLQGESRVRSSGAVDGIDLGHLEKGLLKARAFQEKG